MRKQCPTCKGTGEWTNCFDQTFRCQCRDKKRRKKRRETKPPFAAWLHDYFKAMRFDKNHHLGMGDIRLTLAQQDDLIVAAEKSRKE